MSFTTLYLRNTASPQTNKPSGYLATWDNSVAGNAGANGKSLEETSGSATTTYSETATEVAFGTSETVGHAQFHSAGLAAQTIGAGNWAIGWSSRSSTADTGYTWQGRAALYLVNGSTGAIRATIFAAQGIGSSGRTTINYRTCYSTTVAGSEVAVSENDYLVLEIGQTDSATGTWFPDTDSRVGNATAITSDNAVNTTPKSFLTAPASILEAGEGGGGGGTARVWAQVIG